MVALERRCSYPAAALLYRSGADKKPIPVVAYVIGDMRRFYALINAVDVEHMLKNIRDKRFNGTLRRLIVEKVLEDLVGHTYNSIKSLVSNSHESQAEVMSRIAVCDAYLKRSPSKYALSFAKQTEYNKVEYIKRRYTLRLKEMTRPKPAGAESSEQLNLFN